MPFIRTFELPVKEPRPGWQGRFFHSQYMTFSYYEVAAGADVHRHRHPQEEVWHVVEGDLEVYLDGETRLLHPGDVAVVPAEVEHGARAVSGTCRAIVVDYPLRDSVGGVDIR
jgi:quercetin dioxygenase-like cupin family protein